jgi:hypothetical protein
MPYLLFFFLSLSSLCYGQKPAKVYRTFISDNDRYVGERLTLGTDGIFFYSSSCECGNERYAKGTWRISKNKLYLNGFDSASAFPPSKIEEVTGQSTDQVLLTATNHYGLPLSGLTVAVLRDTVNFNNVGYLHTDSTGKVMVDRKYFTGFYLIYECHPAVVNIGDTLKTIMFNPNISQYNIHIDFANAGFDREPIAFSYGKKVYTIRKNKLVYKNKVVFTSP